jgi:HK97 family phage portal protein
MSLLDRIKAFANPTSYFQASSRELMGIGKGAKPRPFNYEAALKQFRHWAYAAAMMNATAVANVPLRLYVRNSSTSRKLFTTRTLKRSEIDRLHGTMEGSPANRKAVEFGGSIAEVIEPHPALEVLRKVNGFQNGYELTLLRMFDLQITGNAYLLPVYGAAGVPEQVWRMPPQWTKVIPDPQTFVRGYTYGASQDGEKEFAADSVDHFKLPNPRDMYYGMGWFEAAWTAIGLHDSKRTMDLSKFDNMARPDFIVSVKNGARQEAVDTLERKITETMRGPKNAGRFLAIGAEVDLKSLNEAVPEVGTPSRVIEEISAVSGVPVAMLLSNDPNRANSVTARVGWYRSTIRPYCKLDEEKLNERWIPRFEGSEDYFVAYDMVSFEDQEAMAKRLVGYVAGGILTPNEGRAEIDYPPMDGGDKLYAPAGATGAQAAIAGDLAAQQNTGN